jgi:dTMP kinase
MKGIFITFEGVEGCGKSTQVRLLVEALHKAGRPVYVTREPGGTPIGEAIRGILLDSANEAMCKETEILLYAAARAQHVAEIIRPKLAEGVVVISDRYADATTAYQGAARGFSPQQLSALHQLATDNLQPHLTIVLDVPVADGLSRVLQRSVDAGTRAYDRLESESVDFHERVRAAYLQIAKDNAERVRVVNGTRAVAEIHDDIFNLVKTILPLP